MKTISEQRALTERQLQRIERANPDHFRFPRETPRKQRQIPFVADRHELIELRDAVVGVVAILAIFIGLAMLPAVIG